MDDAPCTLLPLKIRTIGVRSPSRVARPPVKEGRRDVRVKVFDEEVRPDEQNQHQYDDDAHEPGGHHGHDVRLAHQDVDVVEHRLDVPLRPRPLVQVLLLGVDAADLDDLPPGVDPEFIFCSRGGVARRSPGNKVVILLNLSQVFFTQVKLNLSSLKLT